MSDEGWAKLQQWIHDRPRTSVRLHLTTPELIQLAIRYNPMLRDIGLQTRIVVDQTTRKPMGWLEPLSAPATEDD